MYVLGFYDEGKTEREQTGRDECARAFPKSLQSMRSEKEL